MRKHAWRKNVFIFLLIILLLSSCKAPEKKSVSFFCMDTVMNLTVYGNDSVLEGARMIAEEMENKLSVTKEQSDIFIVNSEKKAEISNETADLLEKALEMCKSTGGSLDISIYPVVKAWGFTTDDKHVPDAELLSELLKYVDYSEIRIDGRNMNAGESNALVSVPENFEIDLGCIAKGYTGDKILEFFKEEGIESALINLGGNVQALGKKPDGSLWKVAVTDPFSQGYAGILEIENKTVITSGNYERFFEQDGKRYHHIMNPETGYPADNGIASVTIAADEGWRADALSTALFVMGKDKAEEYWRANGAFDYIIITSDGKIFITQGLEKTFTPSENYTESDIMIIKP